MWQGARTMKNVLYYRREKKKETTNKEPFEILAEDWEVVEDDNK